MDPLRALLGKMDGWMDGLEARRKDSSNKPLSGTTSTRGCGVDVYQRAAIARGHGKWFTGEKTLSLSLAVLAALAK